MPQSSAIPTLATLRRLLGEAAVARGQAYARDGRVLRHALDRDGRLEAQVQGTHAKPYALTARLVGDGRGGVARISSACDCPVGGGCKHVAAALIAAMPDARPDAADAVPGLPPALDAWLARVRAAQTPPVETGTYPPTVRDRLLYVLDTNAVGALTVATVRSAIAPGG